MAAARKARWVCPRCGDGKLAPRRPRRDDTRRYCLRCSEATGRLVEREAPAVKAQAERRASAAADRRKAKAQRQREAVEARVSIRTRDALGVEVVVNVEREVNRVAKRAGLGHRVREVTVARRRHATGMSGRCWSWSGRVHISAYDGCELEVLQSLIAHEVAHLDRKSKDDGKSHGRAFRKVMARVTAKGYPGVGRLPSAMNGLRQDALIEDRLRERTRRLAGSASS